MGCNNEPAKHKKQLPKSQVVDQIEKMKQKREERRQKMEAIKKEKAEKQAENEANGKNIDVDFEEMIAKHRFTAEILQPHQSAQNFKLSVFVRKRPIFQKEQNNGEIDAISCANPQVRVHAPKFKVDGITKYVDNFDFQFDNSFNENEDTTLVYQHSLQPMIDLLLSQGVVTCFAYGQTGSGKTYTMKGLQEYFINDIYRLAHQSASYRNMGVQFSISFFEIYGGKVYDLLNNREQLTILEDKNNNVQIQNMTEKPAPSQQDMLSIIDFGNSIRT